MSKELLNVALSFVNGNLSAQQFVDSYQTLWKQERDSGEALADSWDFGGCLSTVFCLADLYNEDEDRFDYELSEEDMRLKILEAIKPFASMQKDDDCI